MTECKYPGCDREVGQVGNPVGYRSNKFCSAEHDVKYQHLKADARDAQQADEREAREERGPLEP